MAAARKSPKSGALVVEAALIQAKVGGRVLHFYRGDVLPADVDSDTVDNLKSLGYVSEAPAEDAPADDN